MGVGLTQGAAERSQVVKLAWTVAAQATAEQLCCDDDDAVAAGSKYPLASVANLWFNQDH